MLIDTLHPTHVEGTLTALMEVKDKPSGTVRITSTQHAAETVLWPRLSEVMRSYFDIKVELVTDEGLTNILASVSMPAFEWANTSRRI